MPTKSPKRIRVSLPVWGAGPGMGGTLALEFRRSDVGWAGWICGSALDAPEELGSLAPDATWRDRVRFVIDIGQPAHDDSDPSEVRVTGAHGLEADLLALAWSGPQGAEAASVLLGLRDDELDLLRRAAAIRTADSVDTFQGLSEFVDQDDAALTLIRETLDSASFSWRSVSSRAESLAEARELELDGVARERANALRPFSARIARCVAAWEASTGRPSNNASMLGHSAKRSALQRFLEDHALQHGDLPSGRQSVQESVMGTSLDFDVDFDALEGN